MTVAIARTVLDPRLAAGVHAYAGGSGSPVVLLHGLGGSAANWVRVFPGLVARHRVVALDLPGHGGSPTLSRGAGVGDFATAVAGALDELDTGPALVAGHSFGGHVALRLALQRPDLVAGLLLVSAAGISTGTAAARRYVTFTTRLRPVKLMQPFALRFGARAGFRRAILRPWFVADADALPAEALRGLVRDSRVHGGIGVAGAAMTRDDLRVDIGAIGCPAIVVWGARDLQLPVADGMELARRLGAPRRVVADCGHLVLVERPEAIVDSLAAVEQSVA
ncbi:MAG: alpha/beta fold hydrolase [Gaiellaceae bacterium]